MGVFVVVFVRVGFEVSVYVGRWLVMCLRYEFAWPCTCADRSF
jgi:hypothetical protein